MEDAANEWFNRYCQNDYKVMGNEVKYTKLECAMNTLYPYMIQAFNAGREYERCKHEANGETYE